MTEMLTSWDELLRSFGLSSGAARAIYAKNSTTLRQSCGGYCWWSQWLLLGGRDDVIEEAANPCF